jgi:hypothetical protein
MDSIVFKESNGISRSCLLGIWRPGTGGHYEGIANYRSRSEYLSADLLGVTKVIISRGLKFSRATYFSMVIDLRRSKDTVRLITVLPPAS